MASDCFPKHIGPIPKPEKRRFQLAYSGSKQRRWRKLRDVYLAKHKLDLPGDWWRCDVSNGHGCGRLTDAPELDHIVKRSVRPDLVFVESNFQILCHDCHVRKDSGFKY